MSIEQCPPGTKARLKNPRNPKPQQKQQKSFMPFCRKCVPGEFQPLHDQTDCQKCPDSYISPRGSMSINDCLPKRIQPCVSQPTVCGSNGQCVPETRNPYLYSCQCDEGFIGSHCEQVLDLCLSMPCQNMGKCVHENVTAITCQCVDGYYGEFCENVMDACTNYTDCQNGGYCVDIHGKPVCECQNGFEGRCLKVKNENIKY